MMNGTDEQRELVQEALNRWWGLLMQFHGNPIPAEDDPMYLWRIKSQGNDEARQQFLDGYVPQIWELGLTVPDPKLRKDEETERWEFTEPDWDELKHVVTGNGPRTQERLELRRTSREETEWVRRTVLAQAADLRGLPPGAQGPAVRARRLGRGAERRVRRLVRARGVRRRGESVALWVVPREAVHEISEFVDELERNYHRVDGYPLKEKLKEARERAGTQPAK